MVFGRRLRGRFAVHTYGSISESFLRKKFSFHSIQEVLCLWTDIGLRLTWTWFYPTKEWNCFSQYCGGSQNWAQQSACLLAIQTNKKNDLSHRILEVRKSHCFPATVVSRWKGGQQTWSLKWLPWELLWIPCFYIKDARKHHWSLSCYTLFLLTFTFLVFSMAIWKTMFQTDLRSFLHEPHHFFGM